MLTGNLESFDEDKKGAVWVLSQTSTEQLAQEIGSLFANEGYKLEKGTPTQGVYGRGNAVLRILFGAFVPRYKFDLEISDDAGNTRLELRKGMSGVSGGAIGMSKLKKEVSRIIGLIDGKARG